MVRLKISRNRGIMKYAFIHIADIHYKSNKPETVSSVVFEFIKDIEQQLKNLRDYNVFLVISGDIVNSGENFDYYESFINEFDECLTNIGISKEHRIVVPGNHDVDRSSLSELIEDYHSILNKFSEEELFNDWYLNEYSSNNVFENYLLFESEFAKYGLNLKQSGNGFEINGELGVYCLNTAILSFGGINSIRDEGNLPINSRDLVNWCNRNKNQRKIIIYHHPISHLKNWAQKELKRIIEQNFILGFSGHNHLQDLTYNNISENAIICSAPPLFTSKTDSLAYAIVLLDENNVAKIIYREYLDGKFFRGSRFSQNDEGVVYLKNDFNKIKSFLEGRLENSLTFFKDQPKIFIKPKLSVNREFNNNSNVLDDLIENPVSSIIIAHPQFGLSTTAHYMILEAYKKNKYWVYLDANHIKNRNSSQTISEQLEKFSITKDDINCIIIDSFDGSILDNRNLLKSIDIMYSQTPIILMSTYSSFQFKIDFDITSLKHKFSTYHLQALQREGIRQFIVEYHEHTKKDRDTDKIIEKISADLLVLNVHRTPLNILTLLKVFEKNESEEILNHTKMINTLLFILFTSSDTFTFSTNKPDVNDCEFILGAFCKELVITGDRKFSYAYIKRHLENSCSSNYLNVDVGAILNILLSNNILIHYGDEYEFKHTYWVYYFAAAYMLHDDTFRKKVLDEKLYVNYPEIIEFYTGIDGRRQQAVEYLQNDLNEIIGTVKNKIGIEANFNPFDEIVWGPSKELIDVIRKDISNIVKDSKLPDTIKDRHADKFYNSETPYNQDINKFLNDYSVIKLLQSIKAASKALRNSNYVDSESKLNLLISIFSGWELLSHIIFWLSPQLAAKGRASYDGFGLILDEEFDENYDERLKQIYICNPQNVVKFLYEDLYSKKNSPLLFETYKNVSRLKKHFIALFLIKERPEGWKKILYDHMNSLHRNSFYLQDIYSKLKEECNTGTLSDKEVKNAQSLMTIVVAKHHNSPKKGRDRQIALPKNKILCDENKLPIDLIRSEDNHML